MCSVLVMCRYGRLLSRDSPLGASREAEWAYPVYHLAEVCVKRKRVKQQGHSCTSTGLGLAPSSCLVAWGITPLTFLSTLFLIPIPCGLWIHTQAWKWVLGIATIVPYLTVFVSFPDTVEWWDVGEAGAGLLFQLLRLYITSLVHLMNLPQSLDIWSCGIQALGQLKLK